LIEIKVGEQKYNPIFSGRIESHRLIHKILALPTPEVTPPILTIAAPETSYRSTSDDHFNILLQAFTPETKDILGQDSIIWHSFSRICDGKSASYVKALSHALNRTEIAILLIAGTLDEHHATQEDLAALFEPITSHPDVYKPDPNLFSDCSISERLDVSIDTARRMIRAYHYHEISRMMLAVMLIKSGVGMTACSALFDQILPHDDFLI